MLRKDVKSQLFSTGMLISLLLGLVLLVEPQYQYFLYFARWDNKADYINFFFSSLALGGYLIFTPIITVMPGVFRFCDEYNSGYLRFMLVRSKSRRTDTRRLRLTEVYCSRLKTSRAGSAWSE